ncbi:MAG: tape measure protein, partial [Nitrospirales bacterium]
SGDKAAALFEQLVEFSLTTPFELRDLVPQTQKLLSMGIAGRDVIGVLRDIADAASAIGGGSAGVDKLVRAIGQIQAKGRVQGDELLQLAEYGVNGLQAIADFMGVSTLAASQAISRGEVDAKTGIDAIRAYIRENAAGMAEEQSKTFLGLAANIKDAIDVIAGEITGPLFESIKVGLKDIQDFLGEVRKSDELQTTVNVIRNLIKAISDLLDTIGLTGKHVVIFTAILIGIAAIVAPIIVAIIALNATLIAVIGAAVAFAAVATLIITNWSKIKAFFAGLPAPIHGFIDFIVEGAVLRLKALGGFFNSILIGFKNIFEGILNAINGDWEAAFQNLIEVGKALGAIAVNTIIAVFGQLPNALIGIMESALNGVIDVWNDAISKFSGRIEIGGKNVNPLAGQNLQVGNIDLPRLTPQNVPDFGGLLDSIKGLGDGAKKATPQVDDLGGSMVDAGEGAEEAGKKTKKAFVDILEDGIISYQEALDKGWDAITAGGVEAMEYLRREQFATDEAAFNFAKTLAKVATAFRENTGLATKLVLDLARSAFEATQA